ncbi:MAG: glycosyltransferase family 10 domain-containing protein [Janthinobacterium lividum]
MNKKYTYKILLLIICGILTFSYYIKKQVTRNVDKRAKLIIKIDENHVLTGLISPIEEILSKKYDVSYSDKNYNVLFEGSGIYTEELKNRDFNKKIPLDPDVVKIFWTGEAILPNLDSYDLTIGFNRIEHPRYIRFPLHYSYDFSSRINADYDRASDMGACNPGKKYFACFLVSSNFLEDNYRNHKPFDGCNARVQLFHKLSLYKRVESGGKLLNNIYHEIANTNTMEWLSQCKFIIAYENQSWEGYVTEKPVQAYFAGAVPIYYGDEGSNKTQGLNKKAVIYAKDFDNDDDLVGYIKKVDNDDKAYCDIWNQNIISDKKDSYESTVARLQDKLYEVIDTKLIKK